MIGREHLPRPPHAGLHFVDDEQDAVLRGQLPQALQESRGGHEVPALALDGLDDDRRHLVGRHEMGEELIFDKRQALRRRGVGAAQTGTCPGTARDTRRA